MTKEEFFEAYAAVMAMPESENPALYQRKMRCVDRLHKLRAEGWKSRIPATGWDGFLPPPIENCPDCTPTEPCWTHEVLAIIDEYKKLSRSQRV